MKWGSDDCLTDLFGPAAHERISWLKSTHDETVRWVLSMSEQDRGNLFRATLEGQGFVRVDAAEPGDVAIGDFKMSVIADNILPCPWFAVMGTDHNFYVRMPSSTRVVDYDGPIEVYRCQSLQ